MATPTPATWTTTSAGIAPPQPIGAYTPPGPTMAALPPTLLPPPQPVPGQWIGDIIMPDGTPRGVYVLINGGATQLPNRVNLAAANAHFASLINWAYPTLSPYGQITSANETAVWTASHHADYDATARQHWTNFKAALFGLMAAAPQPYPLAPLRPVMLPNRPHLTGAAAASTATHTAGGHSPVDSELAALPPITTDAAPRTDAASLAFTPITPVASSPKPAPEPAPASSAAAPLVVHVDTATHRLDEERRRLRGDAALPLAAPSHPPRTPIATLPLPAPSQPPLSAEAMAAASRSTHD